MKQQKAPTPLRVPDVTAATVVEPRRPTIAAPGRAIRISREVWNGSPRPSQLRKQSAASAWKEYQAFTKWLERRAEELSRKLAEKEAALAEKEAAVKEYEILLSRINAAEPQVVWEEWLVSVQQPTPAAVTPDAPHIAAINWMKRAAKLADKQLADLLGISRRTINNWREGVPIKAINRQRVLAVRDVLERAADRLGTGEPLAAWLDSPYRPDGRTPAQLLIAGEIDHARMLAVSGTSSQVVPLPAWAVGRVASTDFQRKALPPSYDQDVPDLVDDIDE